jgi:hypothetical protein
MIRNPPYFILSYISGAKIVGGKPLPGNEAEFVAGLLEYTGANIPVFGGSASSSFENYFDNIADNYQFANGKMFQDAAIVVFVVCNLHFTNLVLHGYVPTSDFVAVTKLDKTGYEILELNRNEPVNEYAKILDISKEEYLADPSKYSLSRPFGLLQVDGSTFIKEALPNQDGKTLHSTFKLHENAVLNILKFDESKTIGTLRDSVQNLMEDKKGKPPAVALFCSCSGRRPLIKGIESKDTSELKKKYGKLPFFGFYSFGEVGSTKTTSAHSHSQTVTSLLLFDSLLTES